MMSDNDFGKMIEDLVIVTNSQLKIENVNKQQYDVREVMNQGYYAYVDENDKKLGTNYYKNLKILPKNQASKNTLTH
jgi:hypothetical protein